MKVNKLHLTRLVIFLISIYFVKVSSLQTNDNELVEEETSGLSTNITCFDNPCNSTSDNKQNIFAMEEEITSFDNPCNCTSDNEQNIFAMEEEIKSLAENITKLELKMDSIIKDNINILENNISNTMDIIVNKITKLDQIIEEKIKSFTSTSINKTFYNVQELKCSNDRFPTSCDDLNECNSNIYSIMIPEISNKPFPAVCDLITHDGGWTIIQRRQDGSENFYRNWTDYVTGFGNLNGEFFIGLEKLNALTSLGEPQELYIILEDFEGERRYARYGEFKVDSQSTEYKVTVGKYAGNADDCLTSHSGHKFSTKDRDNDVSSERHCAQGAKGAWWYSNCFHSNLNGEYLAGRTKNAKRGISWCGFRKYGYSLKFVQMMIRPKRK